MNAIQTRNAQFADIDAKLAELHARRDEWASRLKGKGADDWTATGRGGDLAQLQARLADALGDESGVLPGCD